MINEEEKKRLTEIYLETFKYHPSKEKIVEKLVNGDNSFDQVDLWFAEAELYFLQTRFESPDNLMGLISESLGEINDDSANED